MTWQEQQTRAADDTRQRPNRRLSPTGAAHAGERHIADLTGKQTQGVISVQSGDGKWLVDVEVVEDHRIPSSTDILAVYEAEIAADGRLLSCRRTRRYSRGSDDRSSS